MHRRPDVWVPQAARFGIPIASKFVFVNKVHTDHDNLLHLTDHEVGLHLQILQQQGCNQDSVNSYGRSVGGDQWSIWSAENGVGAKSVVA